MRPESAGQLRVGPIEASWPQIPTVEALVQRPWPTAARSERATSKHPVWETRRWEGNALEWERREEGWRNPLSPPERMLLCGAGLSGAATCPRHL